MKSAKALLLFILFFFICTNSIHAQQTGITKDGKTVILRGDGTWHYDDGGIIYMGRAGMSINNMSHIEIVAYILVLFTGLLFISTLIYVRITSKNVKSIREHTEALIGLKNAIKEVPYIVKSIEKTEELDKVRKKVRDQEIKNN